MTIKLGGSSSNRLNPLDPGLRDGGLTDAQWQATLTSRRRNLLGSLAEAALGRPLVAVEHTTMDAALAHAARRSETPTLPLVVDALLEPAHALPGATVGELTRDGRDLGHAVRRLVAGDLAGLFDRPSTVQFDPRLPMVSVDL